jgi:hypothetical protein
VPALADGKRAVELRMRRDLGGGDDLVLVVIAEPERARRLAQVEMDRRGVIPKRCVAAGLRLAVGAGPVPVRFRESAWVNALTTDLYVDLELAARVLTQA